MVDPRNNDGTQADRDLQTDSMLAIADSAEHSLNNVFSSILMAAHVLREDPAQAGAAELLGSIAAAALEGDELVDQLMVGVRGGLRGEMKLPLRRLVEAAVHHARKRNGPTCQIVTDYDADLPMLSGKVLQLFELLSALISEAAAGVPSDSRIAIHGTRTTPDEALSGLGSTETLLKLVLFHPVGTESAEQRRGFAERLESLLELAAASGTLLSRLDDGVAQGWEILLPAVEPAPKPTQQSPTESLPTGKGQLVLLVDDDENFVSTASTALRLFGYRVVTAHGGREAIRIYRQRAAEIDLLVTDLAMPDLGGLATIQELSHLDSDLRAIVVTGLHDQETQLEQLGPALRGVAQKPIRTGELLRCVAAALESGGASGGELVD